MQRLSLFEAWALYQTTELPALGRKTVSEYRCAMVRAMRELPHRPTAAELAAWHRGMIGRGVTVRYANFLLGVVRSVVGKAADAAGDSELACVVRRVKPAREQPPALRCPPSDFLDRALAVCRNPGERAFFELAGLAGLRRGEILGLRPGDYDRESHVLTVERQRNSPTRKNKIPHLVNLSELAELVSSLEWTLDNREATKPKNGWFRGSSDGYVFPWSLKYIERLMDRVRASLGDDAGRYLPRGWGVHAFRHWGASQMADRGASPVEIQEWLGDSSPEVAMRYVARVRGVTCSRLAELADKLSPAPIGCLRIGPIQGSFNLTNTDVSVSYLEVCHGKR